MTARIHGGRLARWGERLAHAGGMLAVGLPLLVFVGLIGMMAGRLGAVSGGALLIAVADSLALVILAVSFAFPFALGVALYLEEYRRPKEPLADLIELNLAALSGLPSVAFGLLGLELFVGALGAGRGLLTSAAVLALAAVPMLTVTSRAALRRVPGSLRESAYALGATRPQVLTAVVLPAAAPDLLRGGARAMTWIVGAAAPLLMLGQLAHDALPVRLFGSLLGGDVGAAAAETAALLGVLLALNLLVEIGLPRRAAGGSR